MTEDGRKADEVIHFECDHCRVLLTVDDSLAGTIGPCPSCGGEVTAPDIFAARNKAKGDPSSQALDASSGHSNLSETPNKAESSKRVPGPPPEVRVPRPEAPALVKILIAGLVVLGLILTVTWWLKNQAGG